MAWLVIVIFIVGLGLVKAIDRNSQSRIDAERVRRGLLPQAEAEALEAARLDAELTRQAQVVLRLSRLPHRPPLGPVKRGLCSRCRSSVLVHDTAPDMGPMCIDCIETEWLAYLQRQPGHV